MIIATTVAKVNVEMVVRQKVFWNWRIGIQNWEWWQGRKIWKCACVSSPRTPFFAGYSTRHTGQTFAKSSIKKYKYSMVLVLYDTLFSKKEQSSANKSEFLEYYQNSSIWHECFSVEISISINTKTRSDGTLESPWEESRPKRWQNSSALLLIPISHVVTVSSKVLMKTFCRRVTAQLKRLQEYPHVFESSFSHFIQPWASHRQSCITESCRKTGLRSAADFKPMMAKDGFAHKTPWETTPYTSPVTVVTPRLSLFEPWLLVIQTRCITGITLGSSRSNWRALITGMAIPIARRSWSISRLIRFTTISAGPRIGTMSIRTKTTTTIGSNSLLRLQKMDRICPI